jgi:hypothetical protein
MGSSKFFSKGAPYGRGIPIGVFSLRYSHILLPSVQKYGGFLFAPRKEVLMKQEDMRRVEEVIVYAFRNKALLVQAFTTVAHANENPDAVHNGIPEHVGDKWLEMTVHHAIMIHRTHIDKKGRLVSKYDKSGIYGSCVNKC